MPIVLKSGSLNLLEPLGPVQACNGIALPYLLPSYTVPFILVRFQWKLNFLNSFPKNTQIPNLMKIVQWALNCSMQADGQTDMTELIVGFSRFCNANEKGRRVNVKKHTSKRRFTSHRNIHFTPAAPRHRGCLLTDHHSAPPLHCSLMDDAGTP